MLILAEARHPVRVVLIKRRSEGHAQYFFLARLLYNVLNALLYRDVTSDGLSHVSSIVLAQGLLIELVSHLL